MIYCNLCIAGTEHAGFSNTAVNHFWLFGKVCSAPTPLTTKKQSCPGYASVPSKSDLIAASLASRVRMSRNLSGELMTSGNVLLLH